MTWIDSYGNIANLNAQRSLSVILPLHGDYKSRGVNTMESTSPGQKKSCYEDVM